MGIIFYKLVITLCTNMYQPASAPKGCQVSRRIWHAGAISQWRKTCFKIPPFVPVNLPRIIVTSSDSFSSKIVYWRLVNASWQETQDVHEIPFGGELSEEGTTNTSGKREIVRLSCSWSSGRGEDCVFQAFRKWLKRSWSKLNLRLFTKNVFLKQKGHGTFLGSNLPISNILLRWMLGGFFRKEQSRPSRWYCRVQKNVRMCLGRAAWWVKNDPFRYNPVFNQPGFHGMIHLQGLT